MRIGNKVIQETSGKWAGGDVARKATPAGRMFGVRPAAQSGPVGAGVVELSPRFFQIRAATIKLADALDILRDAFRQEADQEGPMCEPILTTQGYVNDALAGCGAMLAELKSGN